jgi:hypothetical protein
MLTTINVVIEILTRKSSKIRILVGVSKSSLVLERYILSWFGSQTEIKSYMYSLLEYTFFGKLVHISYPNSFIGKILRRKKSLNEIEIIAPTESSSEVTKISLKSIIGKAFKNRAVRPITNGRINTNKFVLTLKEKLGRKIFPTLLLDVDYPIVTSILDNSNSESIRKITMLPDLDLIDLSDYLN